MTGFLDKLNTLIKSSLNNFLGDTTTSRLSKVPVERLGKDIDKEIAVLRTRIDEALSEEDAIQKRIGDIQQQIANYDQQVDQALERGDDTTARHLLQQMRRQEQLAAMLRAELEEHRHVTSDFIQRVNTLDAIVSDARREQQAAPGSQQEPARTPGAVLSNLLRDARERFENTLSTTTQREEAPPAAPDDNQRAMEDQQVEDDLAQRRSRLSKPD